jgi:hypothetical protein
MYAGNALMTRDEFQASLGARTAPDTASPLLTALWHDARGDWHAAHRIAQEHKGTQAERLHAYLHRKEGDLANAGYWYERAGHTMPANRLEEEWEALVDEFLKE